MSLTRAMSGSPRSMKRERDEDEDDDLETPLSVPDSAEFNPCPLPEMNTYHLKELPTPVGFQAREREPSPARSSNGSLSDASVTTPSGFSESPATAFTVPKGIALPPKKRAKLTFAEKEEKRVLKAVRDRERAEEKAHREAERKAKEYDKARRDAEKEAERKRKEAEKEEKRLVKEAEKAEKEKERKAKEDDKRRKEEEKQRIEEEKRRKERAQPKLNAFFKKPSTTSRDDSTGMSLSPARRATTQSASTSITKSPSKNINISEYEKRFPSFFVQDNMKIAPNTRFERDSHASEILQEVLDSYIQGKRSQEGRRPFDAQSLFNIPSIGLKARGRKIMPVREIMSHILGGAKRPIDLTTDSQNTQIKNTRSLLKAVPYKILSFAEDVRPPYKGTYTARPTLGMRRLARNPMRRDLPHVNYDYDSEAEWEAEDGEDIESEGEEDEEVGDAEEDLEEFLDDADAESANARKLVMQGDLEPKSSGLCWEDQKRRGPNIKMYRYLMEVINENTQIRIPIDPFTTHYWDIPAPIGLMEPPRIPLNAIKSTNAGMNTANNKPVKMFGTPEITKVTAAGSSTAQPPKKLVSPEDMPAFRQAVQGSELSKLGLIEVLNKQFSKISKSTIKSTLETIAKRVGSKEADKRWVLTDDGMS